MADILQTFSKAFSWLKFLNVEKQFMDAYFNGLVEDKSTSFQVMACCRWWPSSVTNTCYPVILYQQGRWGGVVDRGGCHFWLKSVFCFKLIQKQNLTPGLIFRSTRSAPLLLMPWLLASPGHQQACEINNSPGRILTACTISFLRNHRYLFIFLKINSASKG